MRKRQRTNQVGFIVYQADVWKCDKLLELIYKKTGRKASVFILPVIDGPGRGEDDLNRALHYFAEKPARPIVLRHVNNPVFMFRQLSQVDLMIFCDCWNLSRSIWFELILLIKNCVYIPYSHQVSRYANFQTQYNQIFHNLVTLNFATHVDEKEIFAEYSDIKNDNVVYLGYPGVTKFVDSHDNPKKATDIFPKDPWLILPGPQKRIIWAPHHSILWETRKYSNFLEIADYMIELAKTYKSDAKFAFKPHPMLETELEKIWGVERVRHYFCQWSEMENTFVSRGSYDSLFYYSDALMHDCGSFVAEYTYLKKPHAFMHSSPEIYNYFNSFGQQCINYTFAIKSKNDINRFLESVLSSNKSNQAPSDEFIDRIYTYSRDCEHRIFEVLLEKKDHNENYKK